MNYLLAIPLAICLLSGTTALAEAARDCKVAALKGAEASVQRQGASQKLAVDMPLDDTDQVTTGPGTRVEIHCSDGIVVTIGAASSLDLGTLTTGGQDDGVVMSLFDGIAGFIKPAFGGTRFRVRTPSAVASVRSTEWIVIVEEKATAVFVNKGAVDVGVAEKSVLLQPGEGVSVTADGALGAATRWGNARVAGARAALGFSWE